MDADVKIKKVKPYPIATQFVGKTGTVQGQIIKLVTRGFIADMQGHVLKVGDIMQISFELPVIKYAVQQNAKVMKTYDRPNLQTHGIDRLAELQFSVISDEQQQYILKFLQMIRQKDVS